MAILLNGKTLSADIKNRVRAEVEKLSRQPCLAVILVGENPASKIYVAGKEKDCQECGIKSSIYRPSENMQELLDLIVELNEDKTVDGILCQLPLPDHMDAAPVLEAIDPEKDVDCFHPVNVGKLFTGMPDFLPCTPAGVMEFLKAYNIPVEGKNCVVLGRSNIVGKPMAALLTAHNGTVTLCHSHTNNISAITRQADILVSAVGRAGFITADMVKSGAAVIDVGMNRGTDGKLCGDVDFNAVEPIAGWITPVPGGVGLMTRAMLMQNLLTAAQRHLKSFSV